MAYTSVKGNVSRVFFNGKGAEVEERFTVSGKEITKRWAAWFDEPHGLEVGAQVEVSGLHDDKIDSWDKDGETRHAVKRSLNKAKVKTSSPAEPVMDSSPADDWSQQVPTPSGDVWNAPTYSDEAPF